MPIDDHDLGNLPDQITPGDADANDPTTFVLSRLQAWTGSVWKRVRSGAQGTADSVSVALASDQATLAAPLRVDPTGTTTQPVSAAILPLPSGAATSALQGTTFDADTGAGTENVAGVSLRKSASGGSVELGTDTDPMRTDPTGTTTQPVSAATLPLPTGAATAANQATANASLSSIDGKIASPALPGDADANSSITQVTSRLQAWTGSVWKRVLLGAQTTANSLSVALASDQGTESAPIHTQACFESRHMGAFGDLIAQPLEPILQIDFVYGIFTQTGTTAASGTGAAVDTNAGRLRIQNGTSNGGSASFTSVRPIRYRPGQGIDARFTAAFTAGVASSTQVVGVGDATNGYFFGYNGTAFGVMHRNGGSDTWIAQASWNVDVADGSGGSGLNLNPTFGNVYKIAYPYMGYGDIFFYIELPLTGKIVLVHVIRYANTTATIQLTNPTLHFFARALSTGSTTNLTIFVGACGVFLVGHKEYTGAQFAADNGKNGVSTETNIISLRNCTTLNGVTNQGVIRLRSMSFTSDNGNTISIMRVKSGVTLGGTPAFTPVSGSTGDNGVTLTSAQSMASFDVAGTTVTGGTTLFNSTAARNTGFEIDLTPYDFYINPAETFTFSMAANANTNTEVCVNWHEDK